MLNLGQMRTLFFGSLLISLFLSCSTKDEKIQELLNSPESKQIGTYNFTISAFLWRDFMPITVQEGSPLYASVTLEETNKVAIPEGLNWEKVYVIYNDELWEMDFVQTDFLEPWKLNGLANGGPLWGPDAFVDVIGEGEYQGQRFRILVKNQLIIQTS
jgi:hypothetical protein